MIKFSECGSGLHSSFSMIAVSSVTQARHFLNEKSKFCRKLARGFVRYEKQKHRIPSTKTKWGGYADVFAVCHEEKVWETGGGEASLSCPAAQDADRRCGAAGGARHLRRGERARRCAGLGRDAPTAHLLRRARPEGVQHLVRRRLGGGQYTEDPRCACGLRREMHLLRRRQLGGPVPRAGQGHRRERQRADEPFQRARPLQFPDCQPDHCGREHLQR